MKIKGLTLAEVMVAAAIVGVVAVLAIPALLDGYKQVKFRTGLRKAVKMVNEAISVNIANGEKSAYYTNTNAPLFEYLQKNMKVISPDETSGRNSKNSEFYTKDDMRFEFPKGNQGSSEFSNVKISDGTKSENWTIKDSNCGTKGLGMSGSANVQSTQPCVILVDVNGDSVPNELTVGSATNVLNDMFLIIVTDKGAYPYGEAAQKIYYGEDD